MEDPVADHMAVGSQATDGPRQGDCCEAKADELAVLRQRQSRVLVTVLVINAVMFAVEFGAGFLADSTALLADSLDMLGDSLVYGFSLYVLDRSVAWRARAALIKGGIMAAFGGFVLVEAALSLGGDAMPVAPTMLAVGGLALAANSYCFSLLWDHRSDDLNLRSTWLCSRNDLIANTSVLAAAGFVLWFQSVWPDVIVGVAIAFLFLRTSLSVIRDAVRALREPQVAPG